MSARGWVLWGFCLSLGGCCLRPGGPDYPMVPRLASVAVVKGDCRDFIPATPEGATVGPEADRPPRGPGPDALARAAASPAEMKALVQRMTLDLYRAGTAPRDPGLFDRYAGYLEWLGKAQRGGLPPGAPPPAPGAAEAREALQGIVPSGPSELLFYPVTVTDRPGMQRIKSEAQFQQIVDLVTKSTPCDLRVERRFLPEPDPSAKPPQPKMKTSPQVPPPLPHDWALRQINQPAAVVRIRSERNQAPGVTQMDTGYTGNCQFWDATRSTSPLHPELGFDFFANQRDPADPLTPGPLETRQPGHGTKTGTVLASPPGVAGANCHPAQAGTDDGVSGVAPAITLMPVRVTDGIILGLPPGLRLIFPPLDHRVKTLSAAIYNACRPSGFVGRIPDVITMSMGGVCSKCNEDAAECELRTRLAEAEAQGILTVAAAGQYPGPAKFLGAVSFGSKKPVAFPGSFPQTIAVAASNVDKRPWADSARGSEVDITAPGQGVWRAETNRAEDGSLTEGVDVGDGTSFATAVMAGVAALWVQYHGRDVLHQKYGGAVTSAFRYVLRHGGARKPTADWPANFGPGIVDLDAVLTTTLPDRSVVCEAERLLKWRSPQELATVCGP
jgi:subtilisin family serine protease